MNTSIRNVRKEDIEDLKKVLDSINLFPSQMLEDMISDYFNNPNSSEIWFTAVDNNIPVSIGYCAPEKLTEGTFNLHAIGVKNNLQGKGIGNKMMAFLEDQLKKQGGRILIVETSGGDELKLTRKFYSDLNYNKEAIIRDFWTEGEDNVVYWKKLNVK